VFYRSRFGRQEYSSVQPLRTTASGCGRSRVDRVFFFLLLSHFSSRVEGFKAWYCAQHSSEPSNPLQQQGFWFTWMLRAISDCGGHAHLNITTHKHKRSHTIRMCALRHRQHRQQQTSGRLPSVYWRARAWKQTRVACSETARIALGARVGRHPPPSTPRCGASARWIQHLPARRNMSCSCFLVKCFFLARS
jgi:hypothetical protein